jgi:hypothetical protein
LFRWSASRQRLLVHRLAPVVDAGRARLGTIGECLQQVGQLGVGMLLKEVLLGLTKRRRWSGFRAALFVPLRGNAQHGHVVQV